MTAFDYELPPELIAQRPCEPRDHSRLMVVRRNSSTIEHRRFDDLPRLLQPGDLLIVNDSRVLPARLLGRRNLTGGKWEGLFVGTNANGDWRMLCQTRGTLLQGEWIHVENGPLQLQLIERPRGEPWIFRPNSPGSPAELLEQYGQVPLPPYIRGGRGDPDDRDRYQTVYATAAGSVAAPTAGLHFTPELLNQLKLTGITISPVTLHVGLGTFQPLRDSQTTLHREWCELSAATAGAVEACRRRGGRVVAVGTTAARTLETAAIHGTGPWSGETDLFIRPPYCFQRVGALVTNFHLPKTSLLLLVAALCGEELLQRAYTTAVRDRYRFYSYGDAMLVLPE